MYYFYYLILCFLYCCLFGIVGYSKYCQPAQCQCLLAAIILDFIALYHGSIRFIGTQQECNGACFSRIGLRLTSFISIVGHNVVEVNWYISAS